MNSGHSGLPGGWNFSTWLWLIAGFALAIRLALRGAQGTGSYFQDGYRFFFDLARNVASGHGYGFDGQPLTAFRVPGYPLLVAAVTGGRPDAWALIAVQALLSTGSVVLCALLARRLAGDRAGLIAGLALALYPYAAWHDTALQETGLFTFLALGATLAVMALQRQGDWRMGVLAGMLLGAGILTRATLLPFALLALGWAALAGRKAAVGAMLGLAATAAVLSPWLVRAQELTGAYGLGTEFGAAVYAGNHPLTFADYPEHSIDLSRARIFAAHTPAEQRELTALEVDEVARSDWYLQRGTAAILADPLAFAAGAGRKLWAAFGPLPSPRRDWLTDGVYAASWLPVLLLGLAGLWSERRAWRRDMPVYLQFACFIGITAVLWAHTSHRAYLDPLLIAYGAGPVARALPRWRAWHWKNAPPAR